MDSVTFSTPGISVLVRGFNFNEAKKKTGERFWKYIMVEDVIEKTTLTDNRRKQK